jgi:hypothetical protein
MDRTTEGPGDEVNFNRHLLQTHSPRALVAIATNRSRQRRCMWCRRFRIQSRWDRPRTQ